MNALTRTFALPMFLLSVCALSGCAASATEAAIDDDVTDESDDALTNPQDGYYFVQGDTRECTAPACGGWFVRRANATKTKCADGTSAPQCYVTSLDLRGLGLAEEEVAAFEQKARGREGAVLRGKIAKEKIGSRTFGVLATTEAWLGEGGAYPQGTFYRATLSPVRCFVAPCPDIQLAKLSATTTLRVTDIQDATSAQRADLQQKGGLLVSGTTKQRSSGSPVLVPDVIFRRVVPLGAPCGPTAGSCGSGKLCELPSGDVCGRSEYTTGTCVATPDACTLLARPACGCDGKTYPSTCMAKIAGMAVEHQGACE